MKVNAAGPRRTPTRVREMLPEGTYLARVDFVERTMSSKKGTPRLVFSLIVAAGPQQGKRVFDDCYLLESSLWRLENVAKALGVLEEFDTDDQADLVNKFSGKTAIITVAHESWEAVNADGVKETRTRAGVTNWRATAETRVKLAAAAKAAPPAESDEHEGDDPADDTPAEEMPF
jgi:hypothetical protein